MRIGEREGATLRLVGTLGGEVVRYIESKFNGATPVRISPSSAQDWGIAEYLAKECGAKEAPEVLIRLESAVASSEGDRNGVVTYDYEGENPEAFWARVFEGGDMSILKGSLIPDRTSPGSVLPEVAVEASAYFADAEHLGYEALLDVMVERYEAARFAVPCALLHASCGVEDVITPGRAGQHSADGNTMIPNEGSRSVEQRKRLSTLFPSRPLSMRDLLTELEKTVREKGREVFDVFTSRDLALGLIASHKDQLRKVGGLVLYREM